MNTNQMALWQSAADDNMPLPELIAAGGPDWSGFSMQHHDIKGTRYYAVQDWIAGIALTDRPRKVWDDMKRRLEREGIQLSDSNRQLKYHATNGKTYMMDFADAETLYRITQRMDSQTGIRDRVLNYLARAGVVLDQQRLDPSQAIDAGIQGYKRHGKADQWIKARIDGKVDRKAFTDALQSAITGIEPKHYAEATNMVYRCLGGLTAPQLRRAMGLPDSANVREYMTRTGLAYVSLMESIIADHLGQAHDLTVEQGFAIISAVGASLRPAIDTYSMTLGLNPVTGASLLTGERGL